MQRKFLHIKYVLALILGFTFASAAIAAIEVGEPVDEISAQLIDGTTFKLSEHRGDVVIINFWAGWCDPCREEMPLLQAYYAKYKNKGLYLIAINMDEPADEAIALKISKQYPFPIALRKDSNYKPLGRIWRLPSTFVIDKHGILIKNGSKGAPVITQTELDTLVTPLLRK